MFADGLVSGGTALENLLNLSHYKSRLTSYFEYSRQGVHVALLLCAVGAAGILLRIRKLTAAVREGRVSFAALVPILPVVLTLTVVAIISPVVTERYIYHLYPLIAVAAGWLLSLVRKTVDREIGGLWKLAPLPILCVALAFGVLKNQPDYLYKVHADYNAAIADYVDSPCVYFDDNHNAPLTQDLLQLIRFDDVFVTNDPRSEAMHTYIQNHERAEQLVVYIDTNEFWSSGYDPEIILREMLDTTDYAHCEKLYQYGLSETYLLTK